MASDTADQKDITFIYNHFIPLLDAVKPYSSSLSISLPLQISTEHSGKSFMFELQPNQHNDPDTFSNEQQTLDPFYFDAMCSRIKCYPYHVQDLVDVSNPAIFELKDESHGGIQNITALFAKAHQTISDYLLNLVQSNFHLMNNFRSLSRYK